MSKNYGDTNFVTGMRAVAALSVFLIHSGGAGLRSIGTWGNWLVDYGSAGVYAFFVISGFSISESLASSNDYRQYLTKRLLRIAPAYYFWMIVAIALDADLPSLYNWLLHLTFLSFLDAGIANSILKVEWSIPIEVMWYLIFPALLSILAGYRSLAVACFAAAVWTVFCQYNSWILPRINGTDEAVAHFSPFSYALSFILGIAAYRVRQISPNIRSTKNHFTIALLLSLIVVVIPHRELFYGERLISVSLSTFFVISLGSQKHRLCRGLFANRLSLWIGVRSYDLYLCHFIIILFLQKMLPNFNNRAIFFVVALAISLFSAHLSHMVFSRISERFRKILSREKAAVTYR